MMTEDIRKVDTFNSLKKELNKNGLFIDIDDMGHRFVVGQNKYKDKWENLIEKLEEEAPVALFDTTQEVKAFAIGFTVGNNKKWKY